MVVDDVVCGFCGAVNTPDRTNCVVCNRPLSEEYKIEGC